MTMIPRFDLLQSPLAGRNLLEASAGTGKTFTIAALYLRLLLETGLTVERILVVTFTEAATEELRDRIRKRIRETLDALDGEPTTDGFLLGLLPRVDETLGRAAAGRRLREALICFDEAAIHTIHGFCQRLLQDKAFEAGSLFDTELVTDQGQLLDDIAEDYWRRSCASQDGAFAAWLAEAKVTPTTFSKLIGKVTGDPGIVVLPQADGAVPGAPATVRWQAQRDRLRACWQEEQAAIRQLLQDSTALNGNKYRKTSLVKWLDAVDDYLASPTAFTAPQELTGKLTAAALAEGTKKGETPPQHPFFELCEAFAAEHQPLAAEFAARLLALKVDFIAYLRRELPGRKQAQNIRHFDDLLLDVRDRLASAAGPRLCAAIRHQYQAAFIDEFQDTDPVQFAIFHTLYPDGGCPVFYIGDPKQAIYSFRGADIFAYIAATGVVEQRYTLATNWRSTPQLVSAVNRVFAGHDRPFVFHEIVFSEVEAKPDDEQDRLLIQGDAGGPLRFWNCQPLAAGAPDNVDIARQRLARAVAAEIVALLNRAARGEATVKGRPLEAGDIAVLVRTHREGGLIERTLKEYNIPGVQSGTGSLFDSREALEVLRTLRAIADPANESRLKIALATDLFGLDGTALDELCRDEKRLEERLDKFREYNRIWQSRGLIVMTGKLLSDEQVRRRLLALADGQRRLTNLLHCFELLHQAALEQNLGIDGLLKWFARQFEERSREEYQIRLETDDNAVKIVTIHKSKGLEYPVVFCPFCWNDTKAGDGPLFFHDPAAGNRRTMDLGSDALPAHGAIADRESLAEQMRLLYVAMTRARYRCYVAWGHFKSSAKASLGYLLHARRQTDPGIGLQLPAEINGPQVAQVLAELAVRGEGSILVEDLPVPGATRYAGSAPSRRGELAVREFRGEIDRSWCVSSFSNLTAGPRHPQEFVEPDSATLEDEADLPDAELPADDYASFMDFPRGALAGSCLHTLFENLDFTAADPRHLDQAGAAALQAYGFDRRWVPAVTAMAARTLATPLPSPDGESFRLNEVTLAQRLTELQFFLPLASVDPAGLARVFARITDQSSPSAGFADNLGELGFARHHGMLQGFIDLVFRHQGRYYLLDWKSNFLSTGPAAYQPDALAAAMRGSWYTLQYHLYLVALHRYLRTTLPGYRYADHFGGVFYVYLRGTALNDRPEASLGIFRDRPDLALLEALETYLTGDEEAA